MFVLRTKRQCFVRYKAACLVSSASDSLIFSPLFDVFLWVSALPIFLFSEMHFGILFANRTWKVGFLVLDFPQILLYSVVLFLRLLSFSLTTFLRFLLTPGNFQVPRCWDLRKRLSPNSIWPIGLEVFPSVNLPLRCLFYFSPFFHLPNRE